MLGSDTEAVLGEPDWPVRFVSRTEPTVKVTDPYIPQGSYRELADAPPPPPPTVR